MASCAAPVVNFCMGNNEDFYRELILSDEDDVAFDLTGLELHMQIRVNPAAPIFFELSTLNGGIVVVDAVSGTLAVIVPLATFEGLAVGTYQQDLVAGDGDARTVLWQGSLQLLSGITLWE